MSIFLSSSQLFTLLYFMFLHLSFSIIDSSLFVYHAKETIAYLLLYANDIVFSGNNESFLNQFTKSLSIEFELQDLGQLCYLLGLQVYHTTNDMFITQTRYAIELLHKHNMYNAKSCRLHVPTLTFLLMMGTFLSICTEALQKLHTCNLHISLFLITLCYLLFALRCLSILSPVFL